MGQAKLRAIDFLLHRSSLSEYRKLMESQYSSYEELCHLQDSKLRKLIHHAYTTVKFYRNLMNSLKLTPDEIQNQEDLRKLPILTKEIIFKNPAFFLSSEISTFHPTIARTGGSTGTPFEYHITRNSESYMWGSIWRAWSVGGYTPGDRVTFLGGDRLTKKTIKHKVYHWLNNWNYVCVIDLDDRNLYNIFKKTKESACKMIYAYPTPLYLLSSYMRENGLNIGINHVITTSEMLFPQQRRVIEEAFQCKVFDLYGANDGGAMAFECEHLEGYHLSMEKCITEVVDDNGEKVPEGATGNLVLTDLENYSMPFIRYQVGDRGSLTNEPCNCGRGLNRLQKISGRIKDFIELKNGRRIDGSYFTKRFRNIPDILLFQVIQTKSKDTYAKVSLSGRQNSNVKVRINELQKGIADDLGIDFRIRVDNSFTRAPSQKFQYIVKE